LAGAKNKYPSPTHRVPKLNTHSVKNLLTINSLPNIRTTSSLQRREFFFDFLSILFKERDCKMAIEIEVRGDIEQAIRLLKKKLQLDGIKKELKRREYYEKPSVKRRRKQAEARRKLRKLKMRQGSGS